MVFSTYLTPWTSSILHDEHQSGLHLLGINTSLQQFPLNIAKQVLNWVQPRAILSIEEHIDLHLPTQMEYLGVMMDDRIVHEEYDLP
jgi:hypothetical protein